MKRRLSIPALWVRMTLWGAVGIVAVMTVAALLLYYGGLSQVPRERPDSVAGVVIATFAELTDKTGIYYVFLAARLLMPLWLLFACRTRGATMDRLAVSELETAAWYALTALGWLMILLAAQLGTVLVAFALFKNTVYPGVVSGQSLAIAFYDSKALHGLLPLSDWLAGAASVLLTAGLCVSLAVDVDTKRDGGFPLASLLLTAAWVLTYGLYGGGVHWAVMGGTAIVTAIQIIALIRRARRAAP